MADRSLPLSQERPNEGQFIPTCLRLRHKLMYVDIEHMRPGLVDCASTTRAYWCQLTQDARGPDGQRVAPLECSPDRACWSGGPSSPGARPLDVA